MPFSFGAQSRAQLLTVASPLSLVIERALKMGVVDFRVLEGHRGQAAQDAAFRGGKSQLPWPRGKHNKLPSSAVDLLPMVPPGVNVYAANALGYWYTLAGVVLAAASMEDVNVRWGGDWDGDRDLTEETFRDLGHFELGG